MKMSEISDTLTNFVENRSLFTKKRFIFRDVWGINPATGRSANGNTSADGDKLDPLHNGISLDLVGEGIVGGVTDTVEFSDNSLFKIEGLHSPNEIADVVEKDMSFQPLEDAMHQEIRAMSENHALTRYEMDVFVDRNVKLFTYVNTSQFKDVNRRAVQFLQLCKEKSTGGFKPEDYSLTEEMIANHWALDRSQRVYFQIMNGLVNFDRPYDMKVFHTAAMPSDFDDSLNNNKSRLGDPDYDAAQTIFGKTKQKQGPKFLIHPCKKDFRTGKWKRMSKQEFEKTIRIRHLASDSVESHKVLDVEKLFDGTKVRWCIEISNIRNKNCGKNKRITDIKNEVLIPFYKIDYDKTKEAFLISSVADEDIKLEMYLGRIYSRYNPSSKEASQFSLTNHFGISSFDSFLTHVNKKIRQDPSSFNQGTSIFSACNIQHLKRDNDVTEKDLIDRGRKKLSSALLFYDVGNIENKIVQPSLERELRNREPEDFRQSRCLVAHNPKTKEIVVQFIPILHDFYEVTKEILTAVNDKESHHLTEGTHWFTNIASMIDQFMNIKRKNIFDTCKRNIIGTSVRINHSETDSDMTHHQLQDPDCPLIKYSVVFDNEYLTDDNKRPINGKGNTYKRFVECQIQVNLEKLGFHLYGDVDVLYDLERLFHETVLAIENSYLKEFNAIDGKILHGSHGNSPSLQTNFIHEVYVKNEKTREKYNKRSTYGFYQGELLKAKQNEKEKSGFQYDEHVYHVVDVLDKAETEKKVRFPRFVKELLEARTEAKSSFDNWVKRTDAVQGNGGMFLDQENNQWMRYQLVYQPITRRSLYIYNIMPNLPRPMFRRLIFNYGMPRSDKPSRDLEFGIRPKMNTPPKIEKSYFNYISSCQMLFQVHFPNYITIGMYDYGSIKAPVKIMDQKHEEDSYLAFPFSGLEKDVLEVFNYLVEPSNALKKIMNLGSKENEGTMSFSRIKSNENWPVYFDSHPLFSRTNGMYLADRKQGSIWSIPNVRSKDSNTLKPYEDIQSFITNPSIQIVNEGSEKGGDSEFKRLFLTPEKLRTYVTTLWSTGGLISNSSIRVELPGFLKETYNHQETDYQEFCHYTINNSIEPIKEKTNADVEERNRRHIYVNMSENLPVPLKQRRASSIDIHFFNSDGSRPRQKDSFTPGINKENYKSQFVPILNVSVCLYEPRFSDVWFEKTRKLNFFAAEIELQARRDQKIDTYTLGVMNNIFNYYNPLRRLTIKYGNVNHEMIEGKISEILDTEGSFYNKIRNAWFIIQNANETMQQEMKRLGRKRSSEMSRNPLFESVFNNTVRGGIMPFEFRVEIEHLTIPLDVLNLRQDQTIYILSDFTMNPDELTNIGGTVDRKVIGRLELGNVKEMTRKKASGFTQTFSVTKNMANEAGLVVYPFTLVNLNDVVQYSFELTNSNFEPIRFKQMKKMDDESAYTVSSIEIMLKLYIKFNLQKHT